MDESKIRMEVLGWAYAYFCNELDKGHDPRLIEVPLIIEAAYRDLQARYHSGH
jgi:hypothetical protein